MNYEPVNLIFISKQTICPEMLMQAAKVFNDATAE